MAKDYYDPDDLKDFPNIGEDHEALGAAFFEYYGQATTAGALSEREKGLIAFAVALTEQCPYCIDAYTNKLLSLGVTREEMMEAAHVGASMKAGVVLAHSTQMRKIAKQKAM